jgi:type IV pilus biogenesis protein CpaD/CtpE
MRATLLGSVLAAAAACSSPPASAAGASASPDVGTEARSAALGDTVHIPVGGSVGVDGGRLAVSFLARVSDSRCPANVVCVWMGDAAVRVAARVGGTTVERVLHTGVEPHSLTVDRYTVTVVGLLPYPGTAAAETQPATPTVILVVR